MLDDRLIRLIMTVIDSALGVVLHPFGDNWIMTECPYDLCLFSEKSINSMSASLHPFNGLLLCFFYDNLLREPEIDENDEYKHDEIDTEYRNQHFCAYLKISQHLYDSPLVLISHRIIRNLLPSHSLSLIRQTAFP